MMLRSYSCRRSNLRCKRGGAAIKFFRLIISNGLGLFSTWNLHPYKYVQNHSQPKTTARSSRSMFAYLCSVSVSAYEANVIGFPSCRRTTPRPLFDASTCRLVSFDGLK